MDKVIEDFHGTMVADPFRWLEDAGSAEDRAFVALQNDATFRYIHAIPEREEIESRLRELWNYEKFGAPRKVGNDYYFFKNDGLQNQPVLYVQSGLDGEPSVVLDANLLSEDGTVAITNLSFTKDGKYLAYALSQGGSDWQTIYVRDLASNEDLSDVIVRCKFTPIAWTPDGQSFFYSRFPDAGSVANEDESNYNKVFYHVIGTEQSQDKLVYENPAEKELRYAPFVTDDGNYVLLHVSHGTDSRNRLYYRSLASNGDFIRLFDEGDAQYDYVWNDDQVFYIHTNLDAPKGRIVAVDIEAPSRVNWRTVIPEQGDVLSFVTFIHGEFVVAYLQDAHHVVKRASVDGNWIGEIPLPTVGSVVGFTGKPTDREFFISFTSYLFPTTVFRFDYTTQDLVTFRQPKIAFDSSLYETRQVFFTSKDGTRVPMFVTHRKDLRMDGSHPTLLYGYGGFTISLAPTFSASQLVWLERGGVYAVANLRGGSEYGEEWHQAGMLHNKQNVFDDFIAAGEYLVSAGYTTPPKLAIMGGSNGGLLVGACMLQRPDLYGAVVCMVPVTDMLRYHRFTVGRYWVPEYGNAEKNADEFRTMFKYSPLHNVRMGAVYPPIIITTGDTDDRVVPAHAKKFAATLQAASVGENPILLRIEMKAGHGLGKPTSKIIEEQADIYTFLVESLR